MKKWQIKGIRTTVAGHGMSNEELVISHPDVPCEIILTDPYMNGAREYQQKLGEILVAMLNNEVVKND